MKHQSRLLLPAMYRHTLLLSPREISILREEYLVLLRKLEQGNMLEKYYLATLQKGMRDILYAQPGMQDFLQQAREQPLNRYHLHLICSDKELLNLPWQMAFDDEGCPYICVSKSTAVPDPLAEYKPQAGPLKILIMISSPGDLDTDERLAYEKEQRIIIDALDPLLETGQVQIELTENGSLQSLERQLQSQHYHILYFSGHGVYENKTGYLQLEDDITGETCLVNAQELATVLMKVPAHQPALTILASCQTAQGDDMAGFRGVADEILHKGAPAVIAMAFSISDKYATFFAGHLFDRLAKKEPVVPAYGHALKVMQQLEQVTVDRTDSSYAPAQWLIPQLYLNRQVSHIVDWEAPVQPLLSNYIHFTEDDRFLFAPHEGYQFIGRRRESAALFVRLLNNQPVFLQGQGGIGKTVLAQYLLYRMMIRDASHQCFVFNETSMGIQAIIDQLLRYLQKIPQEAQINEQAANWESAAEKLDFLIGKATLYCVPVWLFDNMESYQQNIDGPLKEEFLELFSYIHDKLLYRFPVIFTGRYPVAELEEIFICNLNQVNYVDFYRKCLQLRIGAISRAHPELRLSEISVLLYNALGGNYRALELFDELYKSNANITDLLQRLQQLKHQAKEQLEKKISADIALKIQQRLEAHSKKLVFSELVKQLNEKELETLQWLACFFRPVLPAALEIQVAISDLSVHLTRLTNLTLIERHVVVHSKYPDDPLTYYYVTPLVKEWLLNSGLPGVNFDHIKAGKYYEHIYVNIFPKGQQELAEAFMHYLQAGDVDNLNLTADHLSQDYYEAALNDQALHYALQAEAVAGNETSIHIFNRIGLIYSLYGEFQLALQYFEKCLKRTKPTGDEEITCIALNNMGQAFVALNDYDNALACYDQALLVADSMNDNKGKCVMLCSKGVAFEKKAEHTKALEFLEQARMLAQQTGDTKRECVINSSMASIYSKLGNQQKAMQLVENSLAIIKERKDLKEESILLNTKSKIHGMLREYEQSLSCLQRSLLIKQKIGDRKGEALVWNNMGVSYIDLKKYKEAFECLNEGLLIYASMRDYYGQGTNFQNGGDLYLKMQDYEQALICFQESLRLRQLVNDRDGLCTTHKSLGELYGLTKNYPKALEHFQESLAISVAVNNPFAQCRALGGIGQVYTDMKDYDNAIQAFQKSATVNHDSEHYTDEGLDYFAMAEIAFRKGDIEQQIAWLEQAFVIYETAHSMGKVFIIGEKLGKILCESNDTERRRKGLSFLLKIYPVGLQLGYKVDEVVALVNRYFGTGNAGIE